jgi:hypothetical protein
MGKSETAVQHRRHRSRSEADQIAAEYEGSGLSREEFCSRNDIPLKTLCRYVSRYRKQATTGGDTQRWVAVEVASHSHGGELAVLLSTGRRIEVKYGFDAGTLRQLVAALEQA